MAAKGEILFPYAVADQFGAEIGPRQKNIRRPFRRNAPQNRIARLPQRIVDAVVLYVERPAALAFFGQTDGRAYGERVRLSGERKAFPCKGADPPPPPEWV